MGATTIRTGLRPNNTRSLRIGSLACTRRRFAAHRRGACRDSLRHHCTPRSRSGSRPHACRSSVGWSSTARTCLAPGHKRRSNTRCPENTTSQSVVELLAPDSDSCHRSRLAICRPRDRLGRLARPMNTSKIGSCRAYRPVRWRAGEPVTVPPRNQQRLDRASTTGVAGQLPLVVIEIRRYAWPEAIPPRVRGGF